MNEGEKVRAISIRDSPKMTGKSPFKKGRKWACSRAEGEGPGRGPEGWKV